MITHCICKTCRVLKEVSYFQTKTLRILSRCIDCAKGIPPERIDDTPFTFSYKNKCECGLYFYPSDMYQHIRTMKHKQRLNRLKSLTLKGDL